MADYYPIHMQHEARPIQRQGQTLVPDSFGGIPIKRFSHTQFDLDALLRRKGSTTISACVPTLNEEATIGLVVQKLAELREVGLLDEVFVIDSGSLDRTREIAEGAGANVLLDYEILPELGRAVGKGEAIFKGIAASAGDIICWLDGDVVDFSERFVLGLVGPLLCDPDISFVKAYYKRPLSGAAKGLHAPEDRGPLDARIAQRAEIGEGGRVTELTARPLLLHFFPALSVISQPLSGEYAGRRWLLERIPLDTGYGVDVGILIDVFSLAGPDRIAECDLEIRHHRNRPLSDLAPMAAEVSYAILRRVPEVRRALAGYAQPLSYTPVYSKQLRLYQRPPVYTVKVKGGGEPVDESSAERVSDH
ncbi:MAG: glucosyl-3-phosphoglycerate synthase [Acidimicrobiia bacterium]